jgi:hypothetical protein
VTAAQQPHLQQELTEYSGAFTLARDTGDGAADVAAEVLLLGERSLSLNSLRGGGDSALGVLPYSETDIHRNLSGWAQ